MKCAVRFPYGKKIHILDIHDEPLCRVEIPQNSIFYYDHLPPFEVCNRCYEAIGREMLSEYLGLDVMDSSNIHLNEGQTEKITNPESGRSYSIRHAIMCRIVYFP